MPELPEVEVVRADLERHVLGSTIEAVEVLHPRPVRRDHRGSTGFVAALVGQRIDAVRRRGKYFWLALAPAPGQDRGDALLGHLGMSGQMLLHEPGAPDERHLRVRFALGDRELRFVDQRMFGGLSFSEGGAELPAEIGHIARDPLDPAFDDERFVEAVRRRRTGVKRALLDQTLISGIGNIYADEALWLARTHYARATATMPARRAAEVLQAATSVMATALEHGGTSFDALYVNVNGASGWFDRSLDAYGQTGRPCARCGSATRWTRTPTWARSTPLPS